MRGSTASSRVSTGDLKLQIGAVTETVEVKTEGAQVQTESAERTGLLDNKQIMDLMARGRDVMALLTILPGVVNDGEGSDSFGVWNSPAAISGTRGVYGAMNMDGISGNTRVMNLYPKNFFLSSAPMSSKFMSDHSDDSSPEISNPPSMKPPTLYES